MSFSLELSNRLLSHDAFSTMLKRLETRAAAASINAEPADDREELEDEDMAKLHYCARVFAQTDDISLRHIAQSIALNTLLLRQTCALAAFLASAIDPKCATKPPGP